VYALGLITTDCCCRELNNCKDSMVIATNLHVPLHGMETMITRMVNSPYETRLQGIMTVAFIKPNIQSKMINTTTMIPCGQVS